MFPPTLCDAANMATTEVCLTHSKNQWLVQVPNRSHIRSTCTLLWLEFDLVGSTEGHKRAKTRTKKKKQRADVKIVDSLDFLHKVN